MTQDLAGKTALVTGSARGLGHAIATTLAARGAHVLAHQRGSGDSAVVAAILAAGGSAEVVSGDLGTAEGAAGLAAATVAALGGKPLDILVHNAGIVEYEGADAAAFDRQFAVNVRAPYLLTEALKPNLADNGRVIFLSSAVARIVFGEISAYAMTKGAVNTYVIYLAAQLGARGITVNAVAPGAIDTDMSAWLRSPEGAAQAKSFQALQRVGQPGDIAEVVAFLASPAGSWVTGQVVEASGGSKL